MSEEIDRKIEELEFQIKRLKEASLIALSH